MKKITKFALLVILAGSLGIASGCQSVAQPSPAAETEEDHRIEDFFVPTNIFYYEKYGSLAEKAVNLHYFDFDGCITWLFGQYGPITCTPVECMGGDMVLDYSFYTKSWQVELCTLVENDSDQISTWIDLFDQSDPTIAYESIPVKADYKLENYLTNLRLDIADGATHLFQIERGAFVDFLALLESDSLNDKDPHPFEASKITFRKVIIPQNPAN